MARVMLLALCLAACERAKPIAASEPCPELLDNSIEDFGVLAASFPGCPVDPPIETYAGRCLHGRHCMRPCRIERFDPSKSVPDDIQTFEYDAAGRVVFARDVTQLVALPDLIVRCAYDVAGRPTKCGREAFESTFTYDGDHLAATHERRPSGQVVEERYEYAGDRLVREIGRGGTDTTYVYDADRLVVIRSQAPRDDKLTFGYDDLGRVSRIVSEGKMPTNDNFTLHYGSDGHLLELLEELDTITKRTLYRYERDRLVDEVVEVGTEILYRTHYSYCDS